MRRSTHQNRLPTFYHNRRSRGTPLVRETRLTTGGTHSTKVAGSRGNFPSLPSVAIVLPRRHAFGRSAWDMSFSLHFLGSKDLCSAEPETNYTANATRNQIPHVPIHSTFFGKIPEGRVWWQAHWDCDNPSMDCMVTDWSCIYFSSRTPMIGRRMIRGPIDCAASTASPVWHFQREY